MGNLFFWAPMASHDKPGRRLTLPLLLRMLTENRISLRGFVANPPPLPRQHIYSLARGRKDLIVEPPVKNICQESTKYWGVQDPLMDPFCPPPSLYYP